MRKHILLNPWRKRSLVLRFLPMTTSRPMARMRLNRPARREALHTRKFNTDAAPVSSPRLGRLQRLLRVRTRAPMMMQAAGSRRKALSGVLESRTATTPAAESPHPRIWLWTDLTDQFGQFSPVLGTRGSPRLHYPCQNNESLPDGGSVDCRRAMTAVESCSRRKAVFDGERPRTSRRSYDNSRPTRRSGRSCHGRGCGRVVGARAGRRESPRQHSFPDPGRGRRRPGRYGSRYRRGPHEVRHHRQPILREHVGRRPQGHRLPDRERRIQPWHADGQLDPDHHTVAEPAGRREAELCVREHECEDGDRISVAVDGAQVFFGELYNSWSCYTVPVVPGPNPISMLAVNGTGFKRSSCSQENVNTGEMRVTGTDSATRSWRHRGGAGSSAQISVLVQ